MRQDIETERLLLINCDLHILEALFRGNEALAAYLNINISDGWTEFGEPAFKWTYEKINQPGADEQWWSYLPVYKADNRLIGSCGYLGLPDENGLVEIGYEITSAYRSKGLATEAAKVLVEHAFNSGKVTIVQAHTMGVENPSVAVLKKCGMHFVKEIIHPEDGLLWQWQVKKEDS